MRPPSFRLTRRFFLVSAPLLPSALRAIAAQPSAPRTLLIGTSSDDPSTGIYAADWDSLTGELSAPRLIQTTPKPSFLALSSALRPARTLYACNELENFSGPKGPTKDGAISAFRPAPKFAGLRSLDQLDSGGGDPCHVSLDHTGRCLFTANYASGSAASYPIKIDGSLGPMASFFQFAGHGPNAARQQGPHAHGCFPSPDNRFVLVNDLGSDRIMVYRLNAATAVLTPNDPPFFSVPPGSGPRHLAFHPNGHWVYSVNEMKSTINQLAWNAARGTLALTATVSTLEDGANKDGNTAAELVIDPSGQHLYASNRGHDTISAFSIHTGTGALSLFQSQPSGGKTPRYFALDPSGNWLLAANQTTGNIAVFRRHPSAGTLESTGHVYPVPAPTCMVFG